MIALLGFRTDFSDMDTFNPYQNLVLDDSTYSVFLMKRQRLIKEQVCKKKKKEQVCKKKKKNKCVNLMM